MKTRFVSITLGDGKPLDMNIYQQTFQRAFADDFSHAMEQLIGNDLIRVQGNEVLLTETGKLVYDLVTLAFYPDSVKEWSRNMQPGEK